MARRRRYSATSNYAIGKFTRMLIVAVVGMIVTYTALVQFHLVRTRGQAEVISLVVGAVLIAIASRHT